MFPEKIVKFLNRHRPGAPYYESDPDAARSAQGLDIPQRTRADLEELEAQEAGQAVEALKRYGGTALGGAQEEQ